MGRSPIVLPHIPARRGQESIDAVNLSLVLSRAHNGVSRCVSTYYGEVEFIFAVQVIYPVRP